MQDLDAFLKTVQNRAFVTARLATSHDDEALDIVQDSMLKLARNYSDSDPEDWPKLFQRILQNCIKDWYRKQKVRSVLHWWQQHDQTEEELNIVHDAIRADTPQQNQESFQLTGKIYQALQQLPMRQQQAFLLRAWWEYSTEETAQIMSCSQGSVKTHYSRATGAMASLLQKMLV